METKRNSYSQDVNAGIKPAGVGAANNKPNVASAKKPAAAKPVKKGGQ
jgi:hypothetical protein